MANYRFGSLLVASSFWWPLLVEGHIGDPGEVRIANWIGLGLVYVRRVLAHGLEPTGRRVD